MFSVLGYGASGYGKSHLFQFLGQRLITERLAFVLVVDYFFQCQFDFPGREFFPIFGGIAVGEEESERESTPFRLCILDVAYALDGRDIQFGFVGNVFQNHGFEV